MTAGRHLDAHKEWTMKMKIMGQIFSKIIIDKKHD